MSVVDTAAALARPSAKSSVILIPWDHESPEHVKRLYDQRKACGWNSKFVEDKWRHLQREGKIAIHWIVLADDDPQKVTKLQTHITAYPYEAVPLSDSCRSLDGKPRDIPQPPRTFFPVGHISLDSQYDDPELADPNRGVYYVSTLYISNALQGSGLGRAAMDVVEVMATEPPFNGKALALGTLAREHAISEFWVKVHIPPFKVCHQDWYARRGYEVVKYKDDAIVDTDPTGQIRSFRGVYMKKLIS